MIFTLERNNVLLVFFRFEQALQQMDNRVCLPYWDSTLDEPLETPELSALFKLTGIGNSPIKNGPFKGWSNLAGCGSLNRSLGSNEKGHCVRASDLVELHTPGTYQDLTCGRDCALEEASAALHLFVGGNMADPSCAPADPFFFLHHAFLDCQWEEFRKNHQTTPPLQEWPANMTGGSVHHPFAWRQPWSYQNNIEGLGGYYTQLYYNCDPVTSVCTEDSECNSDYLWCYQGKCRAKVRGGGSCSIVGSGGCFCPGTKIPQCNSGVCKCKKV